MVDTVDVASQIEADTVAIAVAQARAPVAAGNAGECEQCEWWMPRLVEGRCAFCRDGRPRPPDWEPPVPPQTYVHQEDAMPESKSVTFVATGEVLAEIKRRAANGGSNNRAALELIEAGLHATAAPPTEAAGAQPDLGGFATGQLLEEVARRLTDAADEADALRAAEERAEQASARADAAESKLARMREALAA